MPLSAWKTAIVTPPAGAPGGDSPFEVRVGDQWESRISLVSPRDLEVGSSFELALLGIDLTAQTRTCLVLRSTSAGKWYVVQAWLAPAAGNPGRNPPSAGSSSRIYRL